MEKFFYRKLQFSGSGVQFSSLGEFAEILFFVHNLGLIYCIELAECSMEAEFNPTYDGEKKIRKLQFSESGAESSNLGKFAKI